MVKAPTFEYTIWIGLREGYDGDVHSIEDVITICQAFCDIVKLGVTVTPTTFVYVGGNEPGAKIGLINYPRFPKPQEMVELYATTLAETLMKGLGQIRCSIVGPEETVMLGPVDD